MSRRAIPFRRSLMVNLTFGVALLGATILVLALFINSRVTLKLSELLTESIITQTDATLTGFFQPVQEAIEISADWAASDAPLEWEERQFDEFFMPMITNLGQVSSLLVATEGGHEYMLLETEGRWQSRVSWPDKWGTRTLWREWTETAPEPVETWRDTDYDARRRPWFEGALQRRALHADTADTLMLLHWTAPYRFFTSGDPGVTASIAVPGPGDELVIIGFDVLLTDLSDFTRNLRAGEKGRVFVIRHDPSSAWKDAVLIGLPFEPRLDEKTLESYLLRSPADLGGPIAEYAQSALVEEDALPTEPVQFRYEGQDWWGQVKRSSLRTEHQLIIGAVIPESDLLSGIPRAVPLLAGATLLVILLAVARALTLASSYSRPLDALASQSERMQRLDFEPTKPASTRITEIRLLTATQERMRRALHNFSSEREDLRIARSIRKTNVPEQLPVPTGYEIEAWCETTQGLGGEAYDAVWCPGATADSQRVAALILDAPGLGIQPTLLGSELRAVFRTSMRLGLTPAALMEQLQQHLRDDSGHSGLMPTWAGILDSDTHTVSSVSAGFDQPLHFSAQSGTIQRTGEPGRPLGDASLTVSEASVALGPGDALVVVSDGVPDAMNSARQRFGLDHLSDLVLAHKDATAREILDALRANLDDFTERALDDDRSALIIKRQPATTDG